MASLSILDQTVAYAHTVLEEATSDPSTTAVKVVCSMGQYCRYLGKGIGYLLLLSFSI